MRRRTVLVLAALLTAALVLFAAGPRTSGPAPLREVVLPADLDAYLGASEATIAALRPGTEKAIVWADPARRSRTPIALVYIHGFTSSRGEVAPLADTVAARLGANLFYTRLSGHGRDADAMGEATLQDWLHDAYEAYQVGARLGERVVLVGTSMGGALVTWLAAQEGIAPLALVLISPAYGLYDADAQQLLRRLGHLPWGENVAGLLAGAYQGERDEDEDINRYWTAPYRTDALLPLVRLLEAVEEIEPGVIETPLFIAYSRQDRVVDPAAIEARFSGAGAAYKDTLRIEDSGDPNHHVIAGQYLSPGTTEPLARAIVAFLKPLL